MIVVKGLCNGVRNVGRRHHEQHHVAALFHDLFLRLHANPLARVRLILDLLGNLGGVRPLRHAQQRDGMRNRIDHRLGRIPFCALDGLNAEDPRKPLRLDRTLTGGRFNGRILQNRRHDVRKGVGIDRIRRFGRVRGGGIARYGLAARAGAGGHAQQQDDGQHKYHDLFHTINLQFICNRLAMQSLYKPCTIRKGFKPFAKFLPL